LKAFLLFVAIIVAAIAGRGPLAQDTAFDYGGLPEGPGRELVFGICQACHSLAIVKQQGLNRERWDEALTWMVVEQEMPPLDPQNRNLVLDYLATYYGSK
jgi:cytochrome c